MERITVLCCSNLTGYRANKKAWMTSQIFTEWLAAWDLYLTKVNLKILLLVDNYTAHSCKHAREHSTKVFATQYHFTYPTNGSGNHKELEDSLS